MKRIILIFSFLLSLLASRANEDVFKRPLNRVFVCDKAEIFTQQQHTALTLKLQTILRETSVQILVFTTTDLLGYDIADFANRLRDSWSIGQDGKWIVIVYKPQTIESKEKVTIQTGHYVMTYISMAARDQIVSDKMLPYFSDGNVYVGIDGAVDECMSFVKTTFSKVPHPKSQSMWDRWSVRVAVIIVGLLIIVVFILIIIKVVSDHYTAGGRYGRLFRGGFTNYAGTLSGFDGFGGISGSWYSE